MLSKSAVYVFSVFCINLGVDFGTYVGAAVVLSATNPLLNNLATLATIPTSCNDTCNAIEATISDCTTVQCVCTSSNGNSLTTCVDCLEAVKPNQTVIQQAQDILNQYAALCDEGGVSVPVQTASGFSGSVGLPLSTASDGASQSTNAESVTATSPGLLSPGLTQTLQSTVTASSILASSLSLTSVASSVTSSGPSSTTIPSSSASKVTFDHRSFAVLGTSLVLGFIGSCLLVL
ncbi:hypothetical protein F5050DRAFT_1772380 [Lentinula boryana]|uniref:Extracellular membrane protein CFEM domain-containing protein n=1 Tax=Lentinula boryana TaxID=40481 RepID=A0ABQ8Q848_9AGAR|nr:hypothetical protein F5050DRAFT_1772380 [Lentinula boryana]